MMRSSSTNHAIAEFYATREKYYEALDNLEEAFSGYKELVEYGEFEEAKDYLRPMPDCANKVLMFRTILLREENEDK